MNKLLRRPDRRTPHTPSSNLAASLPALSVYAVGLMLLAAGACRAATIFLDKHPGVVNGSNNYEPASRTCGPGSHRVYTDIASAMEALRGGDTLYVRAGTYSRPSVGKYKTIHGNKVNYWVGALNIGVDGTPRRHTVVSAYEDERVVILAKEGLSRYNPNPADDTFKESSHFYPNPAIAVHGTYIDVRGFKTFGQVVIRGRHIVLENCDLGGGGPHMNQGQVVALNGTDGAGVHDVIIRNNRIHHSCWGEGAANGAALMGYNFSCVIENNEFTDNFGPDINIKDTGGQQGRDIVIRYNFFGPTSINSAGNAGIHGHNQDRQIDHVTIHNNIFLEKRTGISFRMPTRLGPMLAYCNTFVNCGYGPGETGDVADWINTSARLYNNIFYHAGADQTFYDVQTKPLDKLRSDHNLFFSTAGRTQWRHLYRRRATTLNEWQKYAGCDTNSVWKNPQFANPDGRRPQDFTRTERHESIQDVAPSPYGPACGAYATGKEHIGIKR